MSDMLAEVKRRVLAEGPFQHWVHESSDSAACVLANLLDSATAVVDASRLLAHGVNKDDFQVATKAALLVLQNMYPVVEALNRDAGQYLAQAAEALKRG